MICPHALEATNQMTRLRELMKFPFDVIRLHDDSQSDDVSLQISSKQSKFSVSVSEQAIVAQALSHRRNAHRAEDITFFLPYTHSSAPGQPRPPSLCLLRLHLPVNS